MGGCRFEPGDAADFTLVAVGVGDSVDSTAFLSKSRATPFEGWPVSARIVLTVVGGRVVHDRLESVSVESPFARP